MRLMVLPADGIGPQIVAAAETVLCAAAEQFGIEVQLDHDDAGFASLEMRGVTPRPESSSARRPTIPSRMPTRSAYRFGGLATDKANRRRAPRAMTMHHAVDEVLMYLGRRARDPGGSTGCTAFGRFAAEAIRRSAAQNSDAAVPSGARSSRESRNL